MMHEGDKASQPDKRQPPAGVKIPPRYLENGAAKMGRKDLERAVKQRKLIVKRFKAGGDLGDWLEDGKLLVGLLQDYWTGTYREISPGNLAVVVFALLYVLNPVDLLPDALPVIGLADDWVVMAWCMNTIRSELADYRTWREQNGGDGES
ncbi:MAG: YkvA family protein [Verrucomicrobiota bacterium]